MLFMGYDNMNNIAAIVQRCYCSALLWSVSNAINSSYLRFARCEAVLLNNNCNFDPNHTAFGKIRLNAVYVHPFRVRQKYRSRVLLGRGGDDRFPQ